MMCSATINFAIAHMDHPDGERWVCTLDEEHEGPHFATFAGIGYLRDCSCGECRDAFIDEYLHRFIIEWYDNGQVTQWSDGEQLFYGDPSSRGIRISNTFPPVKVSDKDRRLVKARKLP